MQEAIERQLYDEFFGENVREQAELDALAAILPNMARFIDVGANIGQYSVHANRYMRDGDIVAVEANPELIPLIERSMDRAHREEPHGNRVRILNRAAFHTSGQTLSLHLGASPTTSSVAPIASSRGSVQVETLRLDDLFEPETKTLIKIDVEGAEYAVVQGATRFLDAGTAQFFLEFHCWGDRSSGKYPHHVLALFAEHGHAARKVGTHFLFLPGTPAECRAGVRRHAPKLLLKEFIYRYAPQTVPFLEKFFGQ